MTNGCAGTVAASAGSSSISLSGTTINPGAACTLVVSVTGTTAGTKNDTTSPVTATNETATGATSNTATLTVLAPPTIAKAFGATSIPSGGTTSLTFTLTNPGMSTQSGVAFTDTFPTGLTIASPSGLTGACGGTVTAAAGGSSVTLSGGTLAAMGNCTIVVNVTDSTPGSVTNTTGTVSSTQGGTGLTASASLAVVGAPTITEAFNPTTVAPNVNSTATFTLGNPSVNVVSLTGVSFTDTLPNGLGVSTPNGAATTCSGGTVAAAANGSSIALSGATIASGATCTVTVNVNSPSIGSYTNTTGTVAATNSNAGTAASATLTVTVTPTKLVYTTVPLTPITAGGNAGTVSVALEDAANNVATNNSSTTVTLTVTGPSGYSQTYPPAMTTNGVAMFNLSSVPLTVAGTYTYTATASGLTQAQTTEVVTPGVAASFTVTGLSTFTAPQMSGTATVKAVDAYGNIATAFTGTVTLSSTDATAAFSPASYTYAAGDNGTHNFTVTFNTAGTQMVTATSGTTTGSETGILVEDSILVLNTNSTLVRLTDAGVQTTTLGTANSTHSTYGAVAFDNAGAIWSAAQANAGVQEYTRAGVAITVSGNTAAGVNAPVSLFIDGAGQVWVANGNSTVSVLSNGGAAATPSTGYQGGGLSTPSGIIVDSSGSVWLTNTGNNSVTKIFGAAAPVVTPTVTGTTSNTLGTRP